MLVGRQFAAGEMDCNLPGGLLGEPRAFAAVENSLPFPVFGRFRQAVVLQRTRNNSTPSAKVLLGLTY